MSGQHRALHVTVTRPGKRGFLYRGPIILWNEAGPGADAAWARWLERHGQQPASSFKFGGAPSAAAPAAANGLNGNPALPRPVRPSTAPCVRTSSSGGEALAVR